MAASRPDRMLMGDEGQTVPLLYTCLGDAGYRTEGAYDGWGVLRGLGDHSPPWLILPR